MRDWLSRLVDPPALRAFVRRVRSHDLRLALALCLPAALLAIALRGWLLMQMPAAFVHNDTASIVETASDLLSRGAFGIDSKKTFLAPLLYCVPTLLHIPILPFIAVLQHLLGVVGVFLGGLLVYAWFRFWRWLIVPATLLLALDPVLLWYEHVALPETFAVFGVLLVALTATAFYRVPNRYTLAALLLAVFFMAGARPEGRLFALFAVVLVVRVLWGDWRAFRIGLAVSLVWTAAIFALKEISRRLQAQTGSRDVDPVCRRAGLEIALRNLVALPGLALRKFIIAHRELPSGDFGNYAIAGQLDALYGNGDDQKNLHDARLLWGREFATEADARAFLESTCRPISGDALTRWLATFVSASIAPLAPLQLPGSNVNDVPIRGLPWLYTFALLGMLMLAFREPRPLNFHQLWGAFLLGLWLLIMVTANIRARFRVIFEPLWILYALALLDSLLILVSRWRPRSRALRAE